MMDKLFVGIDIGSKNNVCCLMRSDGSKHSSFSVPNTKDGAKTIVDRVTSVLLAQNIPSVSIGMEATSVYGDNLMYYLRESGCLGRFERHLHMLNPKQVKRFKDTYLDLQKNDDIDSFVIADALRFGRITKEVYMDDYRYQALKLLTRARHQTVQDLTREKQRFLNGLFISFSGLAQEKIFSDKFGATSMAIIDEFSSLDELAYMNPDELSDFIRKHGKNHFENSDEIAAAVQRAAKSSYRPPQVIADSAKQMLSISMNTIRLLQKQVKEYDKAIEKYLAAIPQTLTSVKGIGPVYAAGIIAEIGDIHRFQSQASLAKYAGLVWSQHQSSEFEAEDRHMIKGGNHHLKYYLCEAANSLRRCDPEFKRFYDLKSKETKTHKHKRALALTARKLVRLVYSLLMTNRLYTPPMV